MTGQNTFPRPGDLVVPDFSTSLIVHDMDEDDRILRAAVAIPPEDQTIGNGGGCGSVPR